LSNVNISRTRRVYKIRTYALFIAKKFGYSDFSKFMVCPHGQESEPV